MSSYRRRASTCLACFVIVSCSPDNDAAVAVTVAAFVAHPRLECVEGEQQFQPPAELDTSAPGAATAEDALRLSLEATIAARGGEIVRLSDVEYGVRADGRIVEIFRANETRLGEWHFADQYYCE